MEIGGVSKVYRNKVKISDGDRRVPEGVPEQEEISNMYLILIIVITN